MSRFDRMTVLVPLLMGLAVPAPVAPTAQVANREAPTAAPVEITYYDGSQWAPLPRHAVSVEGPGATVAGSATAKLKSNLGGPKTYAVLAGPTSEVSLSIARPRFRVTSDRAAALRVQLAQFETKDESRRTVIEQGRVVTVFPKAVDLEVTRVAEGLWELKPKKSLQPGEYALAVSEMEPVADFTILERGY